MEQQPPLFVNHVEPGGAMFEDFPELPLLVGEFHFPLSQRGDIVDPRNSLAADETDMAAVICNLRIRDQNVDQLALFRPPDCFLVQHLTAPLPEGFDDPGSVLKVVPAPSGIKEAHLLLVVAQELAKTSIVEQK